MRNRRPPPPPRRPRESATRVRALAGDALFSQPGVPEVERRLRAEVTPQLLARGAEQEHVAELDAPHVLVEDHLDPVDDRLALPGVRLARQVDHQALLLFVAPPARP